MMKLSDLSEIKRFSAVVVSLAAAIFLFFQPVAAWSRDYRIWQPRSKNDINKSGKFVLEPRFLTAGSFHNGLAAVGKNWNKERFDYDDYYFIDQKGSRAFPETFF